MHPLMLLGAAVLVPSACLGLLFWLAWLEETLPADVRKATRRDVPPPVLAIPVRPSAAQGRAGTGFAQKPATEPAPEPVGVRAAS